ncbi:MAG TPA: hypothetical protein PKL17_04535 [Pseudomonadota bacterium]|nr:hypothetical protein [Pseudomonadota bacterium]HNI60135.1 hypothetical protein [Pseudomonadota bacterium]HNK44027.1 hypothetical protein [Pseudomonadota bacterium]HNN51815.1 hypothetical protein [Pseudomonadota bacterium]
MAAPRVSQLLASRLIRRQPVRRPSEGLGQPPQIVAPDPRTLEITQLLALPSGPERTYKLDAYFFFPPSFGISDTSYSQSDFYGDASIRMRLHSPTVLLADLADLNSPRNPGTMLRQQLPLLLTDDAPRASALVKLAQLYSAEVADAASTEVEVLRQLISQAKASPIDRKRLVENLERATSHMLKALGSMHRLRAKVAAFAPLQPKEVPQALAFAEEYVSAVIDLKLAELAELIDGLPELRDGTSTATRMRVRLGRTIEQVNRYRLDQGFATPWGDAPEYYSYRIGRLKSILERALYIDTRQADRDPFYRNSAAMVAAGLAATWATLAQVPLLNYDLARDHQGLLLTFAVVAYVLKDRIKEWTRQSLSSKILRWDHDRKLIFDTLEEVGFGSIAGRARERVHFLPESQVPQDVMALRVLNRTVRGVTTETEEILHYHRELTLGAGSSPTPAGFAVQDLLRLSLADVLARLDDPVAQVRFYDYQTGRFRSAQIPQVYHLNVLLASLDTVSGKRTLSRTRVVCTRKGIIRLDHYGD